jgi:hypothetical protein
VIAQEQARRPTIRETHVEIKGELDLGDFKLTAEADRIDLKQDGTLAIIDYKTGAPPSATEVAAGFAPQLPLEALIAHYGGFPGIAKGKTVTELDFWHLKGGEDGGEVKSALSSRSKKTIADLTSEAYDGLRGLVRAFSDKETPYLARPHPQHLPKYSDYLHLARVRRQDQGAHRPGAEPLAGRYTAGTHSLPDLYQGGGGRDGDPSGQPPVTMGGDGSRLPRQRIIRTGDHPIGPAAAGGPPPVCPLAGRAGGDAD